MISPALVLYILSCCIDFNISRIKYIFIRGHGVDRGCRNHSILDSNLVMVSAMMTASHIGVVVQAAGQ
ncbi:hypothetical protein HNQ56_003370 [Anaerotaenia torta]